MEPVQTIRRTYRVLRLGNVIEIFTTTFPTAYFLQPLNVIFHWKPSPLCLNATLYGEEGLQQGVGVFPKLNVPVAIEIDCI